MIKFILLFILSSISAITYANNNGSKNTEKPLISIDDFSKTATYDSVKISPDGKYLAVAFNQKEKSAFAIIDRISKQYICSASTGAENTSVGDIYWISDNRIVYTINENKSWDKTPISTGELYGINADCSKHDIIFGYRAGQKSTGTRLNKRKEMNGNQRIINTLKNDKEHILIQFYPWRLLATGWQLNSNALSKVYKLNVFSGKLKLVTTLPQKNAIALTDNSAQVRLAVGSDDDNNTFIKYRDSNSDNWRNLKLSGFDGQDVSPISFSQDNKKLYFTIPINNGTDGLYEYDLALNKSKLLFHDKQVDITQFIKNFNQNRVIAVGTELALPKYHYIEPEDTKAKLHKLLRKAFSGSDIIITSQSDNGKQTIVYVYADNNPGDYYLFNAQTNNADYLLSRKSWLYPEDLQPMEEKSFTTRDNNSIHGYFTKPRSKEKQYPLVVIPHGGPHGVRDYWQYQTEVQLLANRGYAVLQVNFRGSGGFGKAHQEAGYGKWGTLMQDDITDAVNALVTDNIVDKNRICIYGASYGGYSALMGTIRTPNLFKCAIGSVGVYDLPLMFKKGDVPTRKSGLAYLKDVLGEDKVDLEQRSPSYNADKIKADILLIHGKQDNRAPIEQVESLMSAMDKHNKKYQYLEISDEGHGYRDPKNKALVFKTILSFLDKNIGH